MRDSSTSINSTEPDMRNSINQRTYTIQALTSVACIGASAAKPIASASSYITSIEWLTGNALRCLHNRLHTLRTPHALRLQRCQRALNRHYGAIGAGQAHGNARLHDRIARGDALSRCIVVRAIFSIGHQIAAPVRMHSGNASWNGRTDTWLRWSAGSTAANLWRPVGSPWRIF